MNVTFSYEHILHVYLLYTGISNKSKPYFLVSAIRLAVKIKNRNYITTDQPEKSMSTLRETAAQCCKQVYIGAAVLPKQLFVPDFDDDEEIVDGDNNITPRTKIKCATISTVEPEDDPYLSQSAKDRPPTRYAKVLSSEFNSVVIEHHLKWSSFVHT